MNHNDKEWLNLKKPMPIRKVTLEDVKRTYTWTQLQKRPPLTGEEFIKLWNKAADRLRRESACNVEEQLHLGSKTEE
jgi:hypothetical protein